MTVTAKIILDSVSEAGKRLTTIEIESPRFLLPELNTHRMFSRNFQSSRAIPVKKLLEKVRTNPWEPTVWLKNKAGMRGGEPMSAEEIEAAREVWRRGAREAADTAERLMHLDVHKQWSNRPLEPYVYVKGLVSATDWDNFFELRDHPDAQPEMQILARAMKKAMAESEPGKLGSNEFHLPYITHADYEEKRPSFDLIRASVARCARVSYLTHDGERPSIQKDIALYERLVGSRPLHASPAEHVAHPLWGGFPNARSRNFRGWVQHRVSLEEDLA